MGFLVVIPLAAAICIVFNRYFEETIALAMCIVIGMLFLSGVFSTFIPGLCICLLMCFFSLVYCLAAIIRHSSAVKELVFTPTFFIYLLCILLFSIIDLGINVSNPDEYCHWALAIKNYIYMNDYSNLYPSTDMFPTYLPGASLWGYFNCKLWIGGYSAGICILGQNMLFFSFLIPVFSVIRNRNKVSTISLFAFIFLVPIGILSSVYSGLMVDSLMGATSVYVLYMFYLFFRSNKGFYLICTASGLMALCSFKEFGIVMAVIDAVIICFAMIIMIIINDKEMIHINLVKTVLIICVSICIIPVFWYSYIAITGVSNISAVGINTTDKGHVGNLIEQYNNTNNSNVDEQDKDNKYHDIKASVIKQLTDNNHVGDTIHLSFVAIIVLVLYIAIIRKHYFSGSKYRNTDGSFSNFYLMCAAFGSIIYVLALCVAYNYMFSDSQAREATMAGRYVLPCDYVLIFLTAFLVLHESRQKYVGRIIAFLLGFSLLFTNYSSLLNIFCNKLPEREYNGISTSGVIINTGDKIYYVNQISEEFKWSGYEFNLYIMPGVSNTDNYMLYKDDDLNKEQVSAEVFSSYLIDGDYDYVYIDNIYIVSSFADQYGELFLDKSEIHSDELYKVVRNEDGSISLANA